MCEVTSNNKRRWLSSFTAFQVCTHKTSPQCKINVQESWSITLINTSAEYSIQKRGLINFSHIWPIYPTHSDQRIFSKFRKEILIILFLLSQEKCVLIFAWGVWGFLFTLHHVTHPLVRGTMIILATCRVGWRRVNHNFTIKWSNFEILISKRGLISFSKTYPFSIRHIRKASWENAKNHDQIIISQSHEKSAQNLYLSILLLFYSHFLVFETHLLSKFRS